MCTLALYNSFIYPLAPFSAFFQRYSIREHGCNTGQYVALTSIKMGYMIDVIVHSRSFLVELTFVLYFRRKNPINCISGSPSLFLFTLDSSMVTEIYVHFVKMHVLYVRCWSLANFISPYLI